MFRNDSREEPRKYSLPRAVVQSGWLADFEQQTRVAGALTGLRKGFAVKSKPISFRDRGARFLLSSSPGIGKQDSLRTGWYVKFALAIRGQ